MPSRAPGSTSERPVLIAAALREELQALERRSTDLSPHPLPGLPDGELLTGRLGGRSVALLRCGVGKVSAASAVAAASAIEPRLIVSVGSAAALRDGHRVGDVVISTEVLQHDFAAVTATGFTLFGYGSDLPSEGEPVMRSDPTLAELAAQAARSEGATHGFAVGVGRIATGDWFVNDRATRDAIALRTGADLVEMEGAAIAFVAHRFGIPWIVIRSVSDVGDVSAPTDFDQYLSLAAANAAAITASLLERLP